MDTELERLFGNIDIYLFDQLLKGRFSNCKNLIDVGCGGGRNLIYFLQNGFEVYGIDTNEEAVEQVRLLSKTLAPDNPLKNFIAAEAENMPFDDGTFDLAICNAVLHFADNRDHFDAMLRSIWRVLKPDGYLFVRTASAIGLEHLISPAGKGRYILPDGSERFLVNEQILLAYTDLLGGELFEPIKTTNVQNLRCMTTWCVKKTRPFTDQTDKA